MAELHPDRRPQNAADSGNDMPLSELTALYDQALQFHRRHGRLPGAPPPRHAFAETDRLSARQAVSKDRAQSPGRLHGSRLILVVLLATGVYLILGGTPEKQPQPQPPVPLPSEPMPAEPDPLLRQLEIGMDMDTVMAIQGRPTNMRERVWEYGPSWIRFENGRAVEWYSSPLQRLKAPLSTAASIAPPAD
ncbi:MAG: hypothetical protein QM761_04860 [Pseudoxanthomonas sp.]